MCLEAVLHISLKEYLKDEIIKFYNNNINLKKANLLGEKKICFDITDTS
jgi:hypothetical protein